MRAALAFTGGGAKCTPGTMRLERDEGRRAFYKAAGFLQKQSVRTGSVVKSILVKSDS
jgi:hypothetical protein